MRSNHFSRILFSTRWVVATAVCVLFSLSACTPPPTSYRLLSDEVISAVKHPPYSLAQVKHAQASLRWRIAGRLSQTTIQSELKSFACLMVSQQLDQTTARGELAPSELPCTHSEGKQCAHLCKRSRLPRAIRLPAEYEEIAKRHDEILWSDLKLISERETSPRWERYLTDCLSCERSDLVKSEICLRDVAGVAFTDERIPHTPLDRWLNQCSDLTDPKVSAYIRFRTFMLTPPEDTPYPLEIDHLPEGLQAQLSAHVFLGAAIRLARGPLDAQAIATLLDDEAAQRLTSQAWLTLRAKLQSRLDAPLMPCLEHGFEVCISSAQIAQAREQAPQYLANCKLCEHKEQVTSWLASLALKYEPLWLSQTRSPAEVLLKHSTPAALLLREASVLSRLSLEGSEDHLTWYVELGADGEEELIYPEPKLAGRGTARAPWVLVKTRRALQAIDPVTGILRWSYRFPFTADGDLLGCRDIAPLPAQRLGGRLSDGGAVCTRQESMLFLNAMGEPMLQLNCPKDKGCGELVSLSTSSNGLTQSSALLTMKHAKPSSQKDQLSQYTLSRYQLAGLDILGHEVEQRSPLTRPSDMPDIYDVFDVTQSLPEEQSPQLVIISKSKGQLFISAHHLDSLDEIWKAKLGRDKLLYRPSIQYDQLDQPILGVVTTKGWVGINLLDGSRHGQAKLPRRRLSSKDVQQAIQSPASWRFFGEGILVLHPLHKRLYHSEEFDRLSRTFFDFEQLDPASRLVRLDDQWVVSSPNTGEIIGLHPRLERETWKWSLPPFISMELGRRWALIRETKATHVLRVQPQSPDQVSSSVSDDDASACSRGDRWDCLNQGDLLIGLSIEENETAQTRQLLSWFDTQSKHKDDAQSLPLDTALTAQWVWSSACEWGVSLACTRLGLLAELGLYSQRTGELSQGWPLYIEAAKLYQRGIKLGDPTAHFRMGVLAEEGKCIKRDYSVSRSSYASACEAGLAIACARWGLLNELGLGGAPRLATAYSAYDRACRDGVRWACDRMRSSTP